MGNDDPHHDDRFGGEHWIDTAALRETYHDELDLLEELVGIFVQEGARLFTQLELALAAGDASRLVRAAHALRGSVSNFCAPRAVALFQGVEKAARDGRLAGLESEVEGMKQCLSSVTVELQALCRQWAGGAR